MKKLILLSFLYTGAFFTTSAQKSAVVKVPVAAKASFAKQYPGVTGKWEKEAGNYEVNFKQNGTIMSALLDEKGLIIETETDIKVNDLPATVLTYVKEHYKGKVIKEGAKITKADGTINYEAEVNKRDLIFDAKGKFIKEVKD